MCNDLDFLFKPIVLVTGFGPFIDCPINPSWEAVKLIDKDKMERKHSIELVLLEIPVTYENVDEFVPALWETHTPKLVIHVGLSELAESFTIESQAHRKGYKRLDYFDKSPPNFTCPAEGAMRIQTRLNVDRICEEFNNLLADEKISASRSYDAGRYLSEYIYYTSLSVDPMRTLFVHVPHVNIYPSDVTARGLERIIDSCLDQLSEGIIEKLNNTKLTD